MMLRVNGGGSGSRGRQQWVGGGEIKGNAR
jgi:hypothetical protein